MVWDARNFFSDTFPLLSTVVRNWHVAVAVVLMTTQPLLTEACVQDDGQYGFSMVSVTLFAEVLKLWVSAGVYCMLPPSERSHSSVGVRDVLHFAVPALVYFANNNLMFFIIARINATQFQILSCLKTVFTALLFRAVLCRILSTAKWAAIVTLASGAASSQIHQTCAVLARGEEGSGYSAEHSDATLGVFATVLSSFLSSFAGIYSEMLLKKDAQLHSIHLQNSMLYAWGVVFNTIGVAVFDGQFIARNGLFHGYTRWTWMLLVNNALAGLAISAVLKHADNIVRVFAHTGAMVLTASINVVAFDAHMTPELPLSIAIVGSSTISYAADGPIKPRPNARTFLDRQESSLPESGTRHTTELTSR